MKQKLLLKAMLLLCALIAGSSSVWADNESYSAAAGPSFTGGTHFTLTVDKNSGNAPAYNDSEKGVRLYPGSYLSIAPQNGETITAVTLSVKCNTGGKNNVYPTGVSANTGTITAGATPGESVTSISWEGSTTSTLTFTVAGSAGNVSVKTVAITYTASSTPTHTATFSINGNTSTADFLEGAAIVFPAVNSVGGLRHVGWTTSSIASAQDTAPVPLLLEATMSTSDVTYYAVFALINTDKYVLDYSVETDLQSSKDWGAYGTAYSYTATDGSAWTVKANKNSGMQINKSKDSSIKIPTCPTDIVSISIESSAKAVGFSASDYTGGAIGDVNYIATGTDAATQILDFSGKSVKTGYIVPTNSGAAVITKIVVNFINSAYNYCTSIPATVPVTIGATGWATFSSIYTLDFSSASPAGLNAYMVTGAADGAITKSDAVDNVPGNTGLLLNGAAGDYTIPVLASSSTDVSANKMKACVTATTVNYNSNSGYNYVLAANGGKAEFQKIVSGTYGSVNISAGKAYLALTSDPASGGAPALSLNLDNETGINALNVEHETLNGEVYNLAGQRVANPTKGLYIVNGKKVIVK